MEFRLSGACGVYKNRNYGRLTCFHCLLSPDGDDPIFIGINRLVAKGLIEGKQEKHSIQYPCQIANRFQWPNERTNNTGANDAQTINSYFDVGDLFRLQKMAFIIEIALAKARKDDSEIQIKNKQDLINALTDRETLTKILQQADDTLKSTEYIREISAGQDNSCIVDYFMRIKAKIGLEELRFY